MEMTVQNIKTLLEKREKLLRAQEFYMREYESTKGNDKKLAQMHYFGIVNHIKQLDFEIILGFIELETRHPEIPKQTIEQKIAGFRTMVVG